MDLHVVGISLRVHYGISIKRLTLIAFVYEVVYFHMICYFCCNDCFSACFGAVGISKEV